MNSVKKGWVIFFLIILFIVLVCLLKFRNTMPVAGENLDLRENWHIKLNRDVTEISKSGNNSVLFVRTSNKLYAFDANSAKEIWAVDVKSQIEPSVPVENNDIVYIVDGLALRALDIEKGREIWRQSLSDAGARIVDVSDDVVIINQVSYAIETYRSLTGELLWSVPAGRGPVKSYIMGDLVVIPDHGINAYSLLSGKLVWGYGEAIIGQNSSYDGIIYYTSKDFVHAFDTNSQMELWSKLFPDNGFRMFYNQGDDLLMVDNNFFYNIDVKFGEIKWKIPLDKPLNPIAFNNYYAVLEGFKGIIHIVNSQTGEITDYIRISGSKFSAEESQKIIQVEDKIVFFEGKHVYAYR